jgi:hypothetical protein
MLLLWQSASVVRATRDKASPDTVMKAVEIA